MNRMVLLALMAGISLCFTACAGTSKEEASTEPATEATVEETQAEATEEAEEPSEDEKEPADTEAVFTEYINSLNKLGGTTFKMNGNYDQTAGLYAVIESESGVLYWQYNTVNDGLTTVNYDGASNTLEVDSLSVDENGNVVVTDSVTISDFIGFDDEHKILFSGLSLPDRQDVMMIESREKGYTFADGISYHLTYIEVCEDGSLDMFYNDGLAGSGDEDITYDLRTSYNEEFGSEYTQEEFEDIFYNGNMIIEQENMPVYATITFKSDSGAIADTGDWDAAGEIASKLYDSMEDPNETVYWGEGKFETDSSFQ